MLQMNESLATGRKYGATTYNIKRFTELTESLTQNETDALLSSLEILARSRVSSGEQLKPADSAAFRLNSLVTKREKEILVLIANGYTRADIAKSLGISKNTAASHIGHIYQKLSISSVAEATQVAIRAGLLQCDK